MTHGRWLKERVASMVGQGVVECMSCSVLRHATVGTGLMQTIDSYTGAKWQKDAGTDLAAWQDTALKFQRRPGP